MKVLGIETSCDETAAAVVEDGQEVRSSVVSSQIALHSGYGGVVPELAAREHLRAMSPVVSSALAEAGCTPADIDGVAVTNSPGLVPALLVGVSYAKGFSLAHHCPLVGINHFLAHIYGALMAAEPPQSSGPAVPQSPGPSAPDRFPLLALVVSGGHTALVLVGSDGETTILGSTLDDAAGEAFDKAAKILDLGYPGGPVIDRIAKTGNPKAHRFPRALTGTTGRRPREEDRHNFSFSGVKTALLYTVRNRELSEQELADAVASYQAAIVDVLVRKTVRAADETGARCIVVCGGVACNSQLRAEMAVAAEKHGHPLLIAPPRLCTDNAAMVAGLAYHYLSHGRTSGLDLSVRARLGTDLGVLPFAPDAIPPAPVPDN